MKTAHVILLVIATAVVTAAASFMISSHINTKVQAYYEESTRPPGPVDMEAMMEHLERTDMARAEAMRRLRKEDPEKFRMIMRKQVMNDRGELPGRKGFGPRHGRDRAMQFREKQGEFLEWMEKNYPQEAKKLKELKETRSKLYNRNLSLNMKKYGRIAEASRENPALAAVLKEKSQLNERRDEMLRKLKTANEKRKPMLTEELKRVLGEKFDVIVRQKELAYEKLKERLQDMDDKLKTSEADLKKRQDQAYKDENVNKRLEELLSGVNKFKWD